ncbi:MAG: acyl-CoA dehydrogenase [Gammaproteobacteria bacterium RBG_16_57_12]|nr:MAG: acyl-CoA dehydrogenase [Gammaproteobacteria bacterium RBG_16_57_12]
MSLLIFLIIIAVASATAAYVRLPLLASTVILALILIVWHLTSHASALSTSLAWGLFLAVAIPLNVTSLRRQLFSNHILPIFRKLMPPISRTEQEALDAGTVWWDGELFSGAPDWNKLLSVRTTRLTTEEQAFLDGPVEELCRLLDDWDITHHRLDLPPSVWQFIKDSGFFGMIIPREYGGKQFSAQMHSCVVSKIASRSITAAVTVMVPNSLGPAELLLHYGTEDQRKYYLPRLARGEEVPCFALTGPEAGSDAGAMPDTGVVCRGLFQGEEITGIRLNWEKRYITLGPVATVLGLAFKLYDPEHLIGKQEDLGITCALIPTSTPGVEIGSRHFPLNSAFMNGPNSGKDVFIPLDWIIGGPAHAGQGWRMLMESLAAGRSISLPALSTGAGKLASRATGAYARIRRQFKLPIGYFGGVEEALARIAGNTYVMEATRTLTASAVDLGEKPSVISAIAKYNLTERMRLVVNDAMDVQGGSGICMGPRNFLARAYQSIPISITVEGANILTRSMITYGQGAIRCHPYVLKEMRAAGHDDLQRARIEFDHALFGHLGFGFSNAIRALLLGLSNSRLAQAPVPGPERRYYQHLTRLSAALALSSDIAMMTLGGSLKRLEKLSGRLADVLSQMYLASATLKRFEEDGCHQADLPLLRWGCEDALYRAQCALDGLLKNFPSRPAAWLLRVLIFPLGRPFSPPGDALGHQVAELILAPSPARDRLTRGIHLPTDLSEPLGRLDDALTKVVRAEIVEAKLRNGVQNRILPKASGEALIKEALKYNFITPEEIAILQQADLARRDVITVDSFAPAELIPKISRG